MLAFGAGGYVLGVVPVVRWVRRLGRARAWVGGDVDAVLGGLDAGQLAEIIDRQRVTTRSEPPPGLTPAQGGVLLAEKVEKHHQVAWLTQQSLDGWFTIEDDGTRLRWTAPDGKPAPAPLRTMFDDRTTIRLGKHDRQFAQGFTMVADELANWRNTCGLWDHKAEKRARHGVRWAEAIAVTAAILGAVALFVVAPTPVAAYAVAAVSGLFTGVGVSLMLNADELREPVRTPEGFARRRLVEGFRRYFAASEGRHTREAAERGELTLYSAWAVALGELDPWNRAMADASLPSSTAGVAETASYVVFSSTSYTASTAPSTSSSSGHSEGGSSGGGVGGGAGGGGGGSW